MVMKSKQKQFGYYFTTKINFNFFFSSGWMLAETGEKIFHLLLDTSKQSENTSTPVTGTKQHFTNSIIRKYTLYVPLSKQYSIWVEKFLPLNNRPQLNVKSVGQLHRRPTRTILCCVYTYKKASLTNMQKQDKMSCVFNIHLNYSVYCIHVIQDC